MYVWHELRNACPLEQSPSNSDGNAGGGGCPVGADQTGIMSIGDTFGGVGGGCCSDRIFSNFRKPFSSNLSLSSVLASLAWELTRACSNAAKRSSLELETCCCVGFMAGGVLRGDPDGGVY